MHIFTTFQSYLSTFVPNKRPCSNQSTSRQIDSILPGYAVSECSMIERHTKLTPPSDADSYLAGPSIEELGIPVYLVTDDQEYIEDADDDSDDLRVPFLMM